MGKVKALFLLVVISMIFVACTPVANEPPLVLTSMRIVTLPTKVVYDQGTSVDLTGIVVTGNYSDGSSKTINSSELAVSPYDNVTLGQRNVIITKDGCIASFQITIQVPPPPYITKLAIITRPPALNYTTEKEVIDAVKAHTVIEATYSNNMKGTYTGEIYSIGHQMYGGYLITTARWVEGNVEEKIIYYHSLNLFMTYDEWWKNGNEPYLQKK